MKLRARNVTLASHWMGQNQRFFSNSVTKTKVCVVGGGPAGFYVTQHLLKHLPNVEVDIVEKLPVPFGLVRYVGQMHIHQFLEFTMSY